MKLNNILKLFLVLVLAVNTSCIHTKSREYKNLYLDEKSKPNQILNNEKIQVKSLIYSAEKYPLEDFFSQLMRGEFKKSFKKIRLSYKPSNTDNEILKNLLTSGLVPVYVQIKNTSNSDMKISYEEFTLASETQRYRSFNPAGLPSQIRQFLPSAVAANVYNVAVGVAVVLMVLLVLSQMRSGFSWPSGSSGSANEPVLNSTEKITTIDYNNYLIKEKLLKPGESAAGLIFFSLESMQSAEDMTLDFIETR